MSSLITKLYYVLYPYRPTCRENINSKVCETAKNMDIPFNILNDGTHIYVMFERKNYALQVGLCLPLEECEQDENTILKGWAIREKVLTLKVDVV